MFVPHGSPPQFPLHLQVPSSGLLLGAPASIDTGGSVFNFLPPNIVSAVVGVLTIGIVAAVSPSWLAALRRFRLITFASVAFKLLGALPSVGLEDLSFVVRPSIDPSVSDELTGGVFASCMLRLHLWVETGNSLLHTPQLHSSILALLRPIATFLPR